MKEGWADWHDDRSKEKMVQPNEKTKKQTRKEDDLRIMLASNNIDDNNNYNVLTE